MPNELIHLFGPLSINSFGLFAALGLLLFYWLITKHPRFKAMHLESSFTTILLLGAAVGILGGKILYRLSESDVSASPFDLFAFWTGGISVLGAALAICLVVPLYLHYKKIPILPFADLVAIHIPLFQAVARLGCFFAGCCFGAPSNAPWAITYTDADCFAPTYMALHPTQLYSAALLFFIFLLMYYVFQQKYKKPGQLLFLYLMLMSVERFAVDFWRADRVFFESPVLGMFSIYQWVAVGIFVGALILFLFFSFANFLSLNSSGRTGKKFSQNNSDNFNKISSTVRPEVLRDKENDSVNQARDQREPTTPRLRRPGQP